MENFPVSLVHDAKHPHIGLPFQTPKPRGCSWLLLRHLILPSSNFAYTQHVEIERGSFWRAPIRVNTIFSSICAPDGDGTRVLGMAAPVFGGFTLLIKNQELCEKIRPLIRKGFSFA